jgi:hypothetical protein
VLTTTQSVFTTSSFGAVSKAIRLAVLAMVRLRASSLLSSPGCVTDASFFAFSSSASAALTKSKEEEDVIVGVK